MRVREMIERLVGRDNRGRDDVSGREVKDAVRARLAQQEALLRSLEVQIPQVKQRTSGSTGRSAKT